MGQCVFHLFPKRQLLYCAKKLLWKLQQIFGLGLTKVEEMLIFCGTEIFLDRILKWLDHYGGRGKLPVVNNSAGGVAVLGKNKRWRVESFHKGSTLCRVNANWIMSSWDPVALYTTFNLSGVDVEFPKE